ncbi:MAG: HPr family phosphocarrier protein [Clostridia bacterium]|jgi:phosphocarrier protein|nr:HPr family phosphocarrier protein [Clostridia bacterium]
MVEQNIRIVSQIGLHARPASLVVNLAKSYKSSIEFIKGGKVYNGKSIMGVLSMAAKMDDEITVRVSGEDEAAALIELARLIESGCGEK